MIGAIRDEDRAGLVTLVKIHVPRAKEGYLAAYRAREGLERSA